MTEFSGLKALVVEDDGSIALLIEDMLVKLGFEIAASVARVAEACRLARAETFDFAMLDVNLDGDPAFPVADVLRKRGVPFVFSTGYGTSGVPAEFEGYPVLSKPFRIEELRRAISAALSRAPT